MQFDRRADYVAISRPAALDRINDIQAASDEGRKYLNRAWRAKESDWSAFINWMGQADAVLQAIRRTGDDWAGLVSAAPAIDPNQIAFWEQAAQAA